MAQEELLMDFCRIKQPTKYDPNWETTYTSDTNRVITGPLKATPLFTVESFSVEWTELTTVQASEILKHIVSRPDKPTFMFHYFSWVNGKWQDDEFYVGKGSLVCRTLRDDHKGWKSISANLICVNPVKVDPLIH